MGIQNFGASMLGDAARSADRFAGAVQSIGQSVSQSYEIYANSQIAKKKYSIQTQAKDFLDRLNLSNEFESYDDSRQQFMDGLRTGIQADTTLSEKAKNELLGDILPAIDEELVVKVGYLRDHGQWTQVKVDADQWADVLGSDPTLSKEDAVSQYRYYFETQGLADVPSGYEVKTPEDFERAIESPKALQAVQNQYEEHGLDPEWDFESSFDILSDFNLMPYEQQAVKSEAISWYLKKENDRKAVVIDQAAKIEERANTLIRDNGKITRTDVAVLTEGLDPKYGQSEVDTLNKLADAFADAEALDMLRQYVDRIRAEGGELTADDMAKYLRSIRGGQDTPDRPVDVDGGVSDTQGDGRKNVYIHVDSEKGTTQDTVEDVLPARDDSGKYSSSMRSPRGYVTPEDLDGLKGPKDDDRKGSASSVTSPVPDDVTQAYAEKPLMLTDKGQKELDAYVKGLGTDGAFEPRNTRLAKEFLAANYYNPLVTDADWYKSVNQMVADGLVDGADVKKAGYWSRPKNITADNIVSKTLAMVNDKVKAFGVKKESQDSVSAEVSKIVDRTITPDMTKEEAEAVLERIVTDVASGKVAEDVEDLFKKQSLGWYWGTVRFLSGADSEQVRKLRDSIWILDKDSFEATPESLKLWTSGHLNDYVDDSLFNFLVRADMAKPIEGDPSDMLAKHRYMQEYKDLNEAQQTVVASTAFVWKMQESITDSASKVFGFKGSPIQVNTPMGFGVLAGDRLYVYDGKGEDGAVGYTGWYVNSVSDDTLRDISQNIENGDYSIPMLTSSDLTGLPRHVRMFEFDERRFNFNHGGSRAMNIRKRKETDSRNELEMIYTELDGRKKR